MAAPEQTLQLSQSLRDDMERRLQSSRTKRRYMIVEGADPCLIPWRHIKKLIHQSQRLSHKLSTGAYGTISTCKAVVVYYLDGKHLELAPELEARIDQGIDRVGTRHLNEVVVADLMSEPRS